MYAIQLVEPSLTAFRRTTLPDPQPGQGDVLIRLRAAALNYIDVAVATASLHARPDHGAPRFRAKVSLG